MPVKHVFIVNTQAGRVKPRLKLEAELEQLCAGQKENCAVWRTNSAVEAADRIRGAAAAGGELRFYACGGDGTLGGLINAASEYPNAAVGLIPVGTGNDFVRNFGGKTSFLDLEAQLAGCEVKLDLLRCNDLLCANMINIGFDCEVVRQAAKLRRVRLVGEKLAYLTGVLITLIRKPGVCLRMVGGGEVSEERRLLLIAIANGAFCGGGFHAAPRSLLADGRMDICMVDNVSRWQFVRMVGAYRSGTHLEKKTVARVIDYRQDARLELDFGRVQSICIDGELVEAEHLCIDMLPGALRFILPRGAVWEEASAGEAACLL